MFGDCVGPSRARGRHNANVTRFPMLHGLGTDRRGDLIAGFTVAAYAIPQVMAYSALAGVSPQTGLWVLVVALPVYLLAGSSRFLSTGPESTTALITAATIAPLALGDPQRYASLAALLALLLAGFALVAWLLRLGFMGDLLSKPVLVGYMAGIAVIMIVSQLGKVTGVPVVGDTLADNFTSFTSQMSSIHPPTLIMALCVLVALVLLTPRFPRFPMPLLVVLLATLATSVFKLEDIGIETVGAVSRGLPTLGIGPVTLGDVQALALPALGLLVVAYSDNLLTARMFAAQHRQSVDANRELLGVSAGNVASALIGGFPISSSASRAAIGVAAGAKTQLTSLVVAGSTLVVLLAGGDLLSSFPMAALGGLVIYAATRLIDLREFRRFWAFRRREFVLAISATIGVLVFGILYGILAAVALSMIEVFSRVARPNAPVLGQTPGIAGWHDVSDYPNATQIPGLLVLRYDSALFFADANEFLASACRAINECSPKPKWLLINMEAVTQVDITGLDALDQLLDSCRDQDIELALVRVKLSIERLMDRHGVGHRIGNHRIYPTLPTAVQAFIDWEQAED